MDLFCENAWFFDNSSSKYFWFVIMIIAHGFFVFNPILSDLAILCKFGLCHLEKNVTAPVGIEPGPLINLGFQVQHYPLWTNLSCAT